MVERGLRRPRDGCPYGPRCERRVEVFFLCAGGGHHYRFISNAVDAFRSISRRLMRVLNKSNISSHAAACSVGLRCGGADNSR